MELLIPEEFLKYNISFHFEDEEFTNANTIIENIFRIYGKQNFIEFYFDFDEAQTFDNILYRIRIKNVKFDEKNITFKIPVYIYVTNTKHRTLTRNNNKIVYFTKNCESFRNEDGVVIKYYYYYFN